MGLLNENNSAVIECRSKVPTAAELIKQQSLSSTIVLCIIWVCVLFTLAIFIEEVVFIDRTFRHSYRKRKTIYVLMLSPAYSICGIIGVMLPRAGPLVNLISNSFCGMAFYNTMCLLNDYLGPGRIVQGIPGIDRLILTTLPCCCCCRFLPQPLFNRANYIRILTMVYQVTLIRPMLSFVASVLWVDGRYTPGLIVANNAFPYLATINVLSTAISAWGLMIVQATFKEALAEFAVGLKLLFLQLMLIGTVTGNIIIAALVTGDVIPCTDFIPSSARVQRLDNSFVVVWMVLVSCCGRVAFRRYGDAFDVDDVVESQDVPLKDSKELSEIRAAENKNTTSTKL